MTTRIHRILPSVPVFDSYVKKYGLDYIIEKYCDDNWMPTDKCPDDLKADMLKLKSAS